MAWEPGNIGTPVILMTWEPGNAGTPVIMMTWELGITGTPDILMTWKPGNTGKSSKIPQRLMGLELHAHSAMFECAFYTVLIVAPPLEHKTIWDNHNNVTRTPLSPSCSRVYQCCE